jgi:hypothetical protein
MERNPEKILLPDPGKWKGLPTEQAGRRGKEVKVAIREVEALLDLKRAYVDRSAVPGGGRVSAGVRDG